MQQPFEAFMEAQQKMMEFWSEQMQKTTESALPEGYEPFREWMKMQQEFMSKMTAGAGAANWMDEAPKQMTKWMELQEEMTKMWMDTVRKTAQEMGTALPVLEPYREAGKLWGNWMEQNQQWMEGKDPVLSFPFVKQYAEVYNQLFRYWEPFTHMIRDGVYEQEVLDKYFSQDGYRQLIGKLLSFGPTDRWSDMLEKGNKVLEHFIEYSNEVAPTLENTMALWDRSLQKYAPKGMSPMFDVLNDLNRYIREILDPFYTIAGPRKEMRMLQLMREVQFNYLSFHVKAAELQGIILEASNLALPDALEAANEMYRKEKELPEFRTFFQVFLDKLENRITEALRSEKYADLQNEVAKTGVTVKSKLDNMVEWSLRGLPIVTKSEEDDIARELHALREKVRHLEEEMAKVKKHNGVSVEG